MAQASSQKRAFSLRVAPLARGLREVALILLWALAGYLLVALMTYSPQDPGWSHSGSGAPITNRGGIIGAWLADILRSLCGYMAYVFPLLLAYAGWLIFHARGEGGRRGAVEALIRGAGFLLTLVSGSALAALHLRGDITPAPLGPGGILGEVTADAALRAFSSTGGSLLLLALFLVGVTLFTGLSWLRVLDLVGHLTLLVNRRLASTITSLWLTLRHRTLGALEARRQARAARRERREGLAREQSRVEGRAKPRIEPSVRLVEPSERAQKDRQVPLFEHLSGDGLPPLSLLEEPNVTRQGFSNESLEAMSRLVELKLRDFGVEVEVVAVHPGPVITRFELQPAAGVKVNQISNLSKDLARALSAVSVRVVEVIPGKTVVGLELPNEQREIVHLSEILRSKAYDQANSPVTLGLGKDISGQPVVVDLARMPHLLVAGTTGSGKSVAINAMLLSLLYKASPKQIRLILIDPKMLELSIYEGIPHLLAPVVTDMKDAANALRWCVAEMERRYRLMSALGVRSLASYNRKIGEATERGEPIKDPLYKPEMAADPEAPAPILEPLPMLVLVIDELADLMMVVGKKVEELIARLAQKARAAGIHLILATQRPSVDVITGLIKANIPTRIAFQVSSRVDSRTILDQQGAEQLLGHGDMLYLPPGTAMPTRVHGAFVDDHEVQAVVTYLRRQGKPDYVSAVLEGGSEDSSWPGETGGGQESEADPLYDEAVFHVTKTRKASISGVQRRLRIGYNRAARLVEEMERNGVVGALQANGSREVIAPPPPEDG